MRNYFGTYTASRQAEPITASVLVFDRSISIGYRDEAGTNHTARWEMNQLAAHFESSSGSSLLRNTSSGEELRITGPEAANLVKEMQEELAKPWYRKKAAGYKGRLALFFAGLMLVLTLLYFLFVPMLSEKVADSVEPETERQLGDAVWESMAQNMTEDTAATRLLNDFFSTLNVESTYRIRISVVTDNVVNAFALPGGRIVVYSALLDRMQSYPELAALLSHEFTHVNNRHATKSIFRRLGSKVFISLLFGRMGSVTSILVNHADDLKSLTYSRKLEKEADLEGLSILTNRNIDPKGFTDLFRHLKAASDGSSLPEFLASHPDIDNRLAYIKETSKQARVEPHADLTAIFDQLKKP